MEFASREGRRRGGGRERRGPRRAVYNGGRVSLIERELSLISYRHAEKRFGVRLAEAEPSSLPLLQARYLLHINTRTNIDPPPPLCYRMSAICLIYRMLIRIVRVDNFAEK